MDDATRIELKLTRVFHNLGLSFAEGKGLVEVTDRIETACWGIADNGREFIWVNPQLCRSFGIAELTEVLRHEFLHRSLYDGVQEQFSNDALSNIVLDIVINKILYLGDRQAMSSLSRRVYPAASFETLVALANCAVPRGKLPEELADLYEEIWDRPEVPNPSSLYYRLVRLSSRTGSRYRFYGEPRRSEGRRGNGDLGRYARSPADQARNRREAAASIDRIVREYGSEELRRRRDEVADFISRQRLIGRLTEAAGRLESQLLPGGSLTPYPLLLSRLGVTYVALGVSDATHLYHNRERARANARVAVYVDASGSMQEHLSRVVWIVDHLSELSMLLFSFDTAVHELGAGDLRAGTVPGGGGTDFTAVLEHFAGLSVDVESALIFTDGLAEVTEQAAGELAESGRQVYTILFNYAEAPEDNGLVAASRDVITVDI